MSKSKFQSNHEKQPASHDLGKRARTRQQLIDAARALLASNRLADSSILEIATAAGLSNGTFYNYFDTKDQLLEALALDMSEQLATQLREEFAGIIDPAERVVLAARTFMVKAQTEPVFGWALVRLAGTLPAWSATIRASVMLDVKEGIQMGRFDVPSVNAAADLILGTLLAGVRTLLEQQMTEVHIRHIAEISLVGLGLDREEARSLVNRLLVDDFSKLK